jgi:hypothetical protein
VKPDGSTEPPDARDAVPVWAGGRRQPDPDFILLLLLSALISAAMVAGTVLWLTGERSPWRTALARSTPSTPSTPTLAVLDLADIMRLKEQRVTQALLRAGASVAERDAAISEAGTFGTRLAALLEQLPQRCDCTVLQRSTVLGSARELRDLTPQVRQELGL